jgi:uncharacterized membrane protein YkoI
MKQRLAAAIVVSIVGAAIGGAAYGARASESDALAFAKARISLTQAIAIAEQSAGGRAAKAGFEHTNQKRTYEVAIVKDGKVMDVRVDADTGNVISSSDDDDDWEGN